MRRVDHLVPLLSILAVVGPATSQASWHIANPAQSPPAEFQWAAAFDEARGEAILVFPRNSPSAQGWRWDGTAWSQLTATPPPNRFGSYMVYDVVHQRVVLWGGFVPGTGQHYQDMWEWDGVAWQQRFAVMPPSRDAAAVAYDRARGVTVMFGGQGPLQDTWEWDGFAWSNPNPAVRPSAREQAAMVFDPTTQRVLLHGGYGQVRNNETWTWNGSVWQQHLPTNPPYLRDRATMIADLDRARVVLHGGSIYDTQTWEWDGTQWHASIPGSPGTLRWAAGVYDTQRHEVVLHGGELYALGFSNQTWLYGTPAAASATAFGTGCAGAGGIPQLVTVPYSLPWLGDTVRTRVGDLAGGTPGAFFVTSFVPSFLPMSLASLGAPGCDLLLPPDSLEFAAASGNAVEWDLAIPFTPWLAGINIYQQAFPIEQGVNPLGISGSNGLRMGIGIR